MFVQGRQLRPIMNKEVSFRNTIGANFETETTKKVSQTIPSNDNAIAPPSSNNLAAENQKSSENLSFQKPNYKDSAVVNKDSFRPTTPGKSPAIGHSIANNNGLVKRNSANGEPHFVTGNKDDFRPTVPGHSPGVGHSVGKN